MPSLVDQVIADLTAAEQVLAAADGSKEAADSKAQAAVNAAVTANQVDVDASAAYNAKADAAVAAISASKRPAPPVV